MDAIRRTSLKSCRSPARLASTGSKPALTYKGRIARPAPPPPGPGETATPEDSSETRQARRAIMDAMKQDKEEDYKKRYNSKARKIMAIIIGTPIALVVTPYLFKRGEFL